MESSSINPDARHPGYSEAARLRDLAEYPDPQIVTLDTATGNISVVTLTTGWQEEHRPIITRERDVLVPLTFVISHDINGNSVNLSDKGIHPYLGRNSAWNMRFFSVVGRQEYIVPFRFWLEQEEFPRAANEVEDQFFEHFLDWKQFLEHIQSQA